MVYSVVQACTKINICLCLTFLLLVFFFNDTATTEIYTLSLHDALPISRRRVGTGSAGLIGAKALVIAPLAPRGRDRKSTRLNSSHLGISYAVFCLKKKINSSSRRLENRAAAPGGKEGV